MLDRQILWLPGVFLLDIIKLEIVLPTQSFLRRMVDRLECLDGYFGQFEAEQGFAVEYHN